MPIVFINCALFPFVEQILNRQKLYETRNRNTLKSLIEQRVYIAMTGKGKRPVVMGTAVIKSVIRIDSIEQYERYRKYTCVLPGSCFDFTGKPKYLYRLTAVKRCKPFIPVDGVRHGRVWLEYNGMEAYIK